VAKWGVWMFFFSEFFNANFFFGCVEICQTAALKLNLLKHTSAFLYMKNLVGTDGTVVWIFQTKFSLILFNS
jgi:hypothetical protein